MGKKELVVKEKLEKKRSDILSFEDLTDFLKMLVRKYRGKDKNYAKHQVIAQAALATAWYMTIQIGRDSSMVYHIAREFIEGYVGAGKEVGVKIINYDKMLFPQFEHQFKDEKTISADVWHNLQTAAREILRRDGYLASERVIEHLQSIVDGVVPFGYTVKG